MSSARQYFKDLGYIGASDNPPCDPGWIEVTDDAGHLTCVQQGAGDYGYCGQGKTVYIDASGSAVCYPIVPGTAQTVGGGVPGVVTVPGAPPGQPGNLGLAPNLLSGLGISNTSAILLGGLLLLMLFKR